MDVHGLGGQSLSACEIASWMFTAWGGENRVVDIHGLGGQSLSAWEIASWMFTAWGDRFSAKTI